MNRFAIFALLSAATMFSAASRLVAEQPLKANVPFAFSIADRNLPPGEYRIRHHGAFLNIEDRDNHRIVTVIASPGEPSKDGTSFLSFDEVNGVRFLRRVVTPDESGSVEVAVSKNRNQIRDVERERRSIEEPLR